MTINVNRSHHRMPSGLRSKETEKGAARAPGQGEDHWPRSDWCHGHLLGRHEKLETPTSCGWFWMSDGFLMTRYPKFGIRSAVRMINLCRSEPPNLCFSWLPCFSFSWGHLWPNFLGAILGLPPKHPKTLNKFCNICRLERVTCLCWVVWFGSFTMRLI